MNDDDFYIHACWAMEKDSSGFARALAKLYYVSDGINRQCLQTAFPHHFKDFHDRYERQNNAVPSGAR